VAVNEHGVQMGAIAGYGWAGVVEIKQLWVDGDHRGHGVGRRLLDAAIREAVIRDCHSVWALSYDFQAPGFYEKQGFERVAELKDWAPWPHSLRPTSPAEGRSVTNLQAAINRFLDDHNTRSKPFEWVADPNKIIAALRRGHQTLDYDPLIRS
jgi:predicted GNAT family acetyltransferase